MKCEACGAETDPAFLCRGCGDELARLIGDVPALLEELETRIARQDRVTRRQGKPRPRPIDADGHNDDAIGASPMPYDPDAAEVRWDLLNTLGTWARHLAESRDVAPPTDATLASWLLNAAESFRFDEAGPEALDEIRYVVGKGWRAVDRSPVLVFAGPCRAETVGPDLWPACCLADLRVPRRSSTARCRECGAVHDLAERWQIVADAVEDALLPLDEVIDALPLLAPGCDRPTAATLRKWRFRGRLVARGLDHHGRELYRGGDVLDLARSTFRRAEDGRPLRHDRPA